MFKNYGPKTLYEDARVEWTKLAGPESTCPRGFRPIFAYGFMRHCLRYSSTEGMESDKKFILDHKWPADMDSPDHPKTQWSLMKAPVEKGWQLAENGLRETEQQGYRITKNWPELFGDLTKVEIGSSREDRALFSAKSWFEGANRANGTNVPFRPIQPMDVCKYHIDWGWFDETDPDKEDREAMDRIFWTRPDALRLLDRIRKRLPEIEIDSKKICKIWRLAGDSYGWFGDCEPLGTLYSLPEHQLIQLSEEMDDYYRDIYGVRDLIRTKPNPVVVDFLELLDRILRGDADVPKVTLRFSHSCACKRLLACLGLFDGWTWDGVADLDPNADRPVRMALLCPNSANFILMAFVKDNVQAITEKDVLISFMVQERVIELKRCKPTEQFGVYRLDDFRTVMIENILKQSAQ